MKVANRGTSHFSATASTETMRTRRGQRRLALGDAVDLGEDALHLLQVGLTAPIEAHAAMEAVEERDIEVLLQQPDAVRDGGRGDAELLGSAGEALVAGRRLEEAQAVERGQEQHRYRPSGRGASDKTRVCHGTPCASAARRIVTATPMEQVWRGSGHAGDE